MSKQPYPPVDAFPNAPEISERLGLTKGPEGEIPQFIERDGVKLKWYSICSVHSPRNPHPRCGMCRTGRYLRQEETADRW